ncbi:MAG: response regulator, partial [Myxococcales bacterium]
MTAAPVHILLVEDNPGDARLVQEALREAVEQAPAGPSYRVTVAGRLAAALEALDAGGVDVVLLDLELPDSRGLETYLQVRARAPGCPIVTLTSNGDESLGVRMLREGAQDYLPKSRFDGESLVRSVRYAQERMAIERERERLIVLEQEARRQAEEASQLKDEFLTTISHELRTPLTAILGWARMLSRGEVPDERRAQALATIERNAQAQTQLIEDLLDMSRLIKGTFTLSAVPLEVAPVVEAALETVRPAARAKGLELLADLAPDAVVRGDAGRLQQVVWN